MEQSGGEGDRIFQVYLSQGFRSIFISDKNPAVRPASHFRRKSVFSPSQRGLLSRVTSEVTSEGYCSLLILLIPHGYLHPGKRQHSGFKSGCHRRVGGISSMVGGHLTDLKNMDVYQEWKRQKLPKNTCKKA